MTQHVSPPTGLRFPNDVVFNGYAAPVRIEGRMHNLEVIGSIPPELNGACYRNSADHTYPRLLGKDIFLNGDGMIHILRFQNGRADLTMRYVRTRKFLIEREARRALFGAYRNPFTDSAEVAGEDANTANLSVLWRHNRLYALKEAGRPYEFDPVTLVICPMVCEWGRVRKGEPYWHWNNRRKPLIAVIPRDKGVAGLRWFTAPQPAMQTHTFNAWQDGGRLHLDHFVNESGWLSQFPDLHNPHAHEKPPFGER
jgi:carotenoid cleavage dioxygenase-like enzyme